MTNTLAAYVPFPTYIPPTHRSTTAIQQQIPAPQVQTQGLAEGGIIILICLAGLLFRALTDRR